MSHLHDIVLAPSSPSRRHADTEYVSTSLLDLISMYEDVFLDHLTAAIVSHALRIAPSVEVDDYRTMYLKTVAKELTAAVNRHDHATLDFRSIFSSDASHRSIPLCSRLPPSEEVASDTFIHLCHLRQTLSNKILFPRGGSKTVGKIVAANFWESYNAHGLTFKHDDTKKDEDSVSVDDCLRLYQETGGYPDGPVEVRASWKYSQITPRVYYARGGRVQVAAQYIQEVTNIIIDEFPEVHRIDRFAPPSEPLSDDDVEVIYDYASFTSTLDAVIPFVDELSRFFAGVSVLLVDPVDGLVQSDLGLLFAEYNRVCNAYQKFDISRLSLVEEDTIFEHTCGMLGVEGNIFIATLLHGIFIRFIAGLRRSKCVGDDGRLHFKTLDGQFSSTDREYLFWMLTSLGSLSEEKIMAFESHPIAQQNYRYVKRPFYRYGPIMITGLLLALPSQIPLTGALDSFHTVIPSSSHPCRIVFKQIIRFLDTLANHSVMIDREDSSYAIAQHLFYLVRLLRDRDSAGLYSDVGRSNKKSHYRLPPIELWGKTKYVDWFVESISYDELVKFPKFGGAEEEGSCDGRAGSLMLRGQSKARSFLVKMGYLEEEMQYDEYSIETLGLEEITRLLQGQYTPVSRFYVLKDVPVWYNQISRTL